MSFCFKKLALPDVILIEPNVVRDRRGLFVEVYKYPDFEKAGIREKWPQVNHSRSQKNVLRGLHYQKRPSAQAKLIRVISGKIFDVAVDIRKGSPFYGKWVGVELSSEAMRLLYIPTGFAHGFCTLSKMAEVEYYSSDVYAPKDERGIRWNDPHLKIRWPVNHPVLSRKDSSLPDFDSVDNNFVYGKS